MDGRDWLTRTRDSYDAVAESYADLLSGYLEATRTTARSCSCSPTWSSRTAGAASSTWAAARAT
ncbi:hypothetical protein ACUN7V_15940 [Quadrisphaera oryzae]|uniref:hypothetical protein n=1 Tax=Quadrisphaera TaxID=317661 RepID=UPI0021083326|nr:hypothetical protein [Quadrisphaera sp. RL12-1S]